MGDELWFYFGGCSVRHDSPVEVGAIGLAKIKKDRFISLETSGKGELLTKTLVCYGSKQLTVNCEVKGQLKVEILDENGKPISGFTAEDWLPISGDQLAAKVTWKNMKDFWSIRGKKIKLRFLMDNGKLFSFKVQ